MDRSVTFRAGASDAGNTLGVFLRQRGVSRHILTILKRTPEGILLNGEAAFTSRTLSAGDQVTIFVKEAEPPSPVAALSLPFPVIYEDEDLLVVDKPSGMAIHPSQGHHDNTLANAAAWYFQQKGESFVFRCINRLDRDTTGLLILAKKCPERFHPVRHASEAADPAHLSGRGGGRSAGIRRHRRSHRKSSRLSH